MDKTGSLEVRDASSADVPALSWIRHPAVMHEDRIREAGGTSIRYLVAVLDGIPVGWAVLVLAQPRGWPTVSRLPQALDVVVGARYRGRGVGTRLLRECQAIARAEGFDELWLGADPEGNVRARALYTYLGYEHDGKPPVDEKWCYEDSAGGIHRGEERLIYLRRKLTS